MVLVVFLSRVPRPAAMPVCRTLLPVVDAAGILLNGDQFGALTNPGAQIFRAPAPAPGDTLEVTEAPCNACSSPQLAAL